MLVLLYYLSQNPNFPESVKPLMGQLKNSEQMLGFLNDLSRFTQTFSAFQQAPPPQEKRQEACKEGPATEHGHQEKKAPQSPTSGIADAFIQEMLESYLKKR